MQWVLVQLHAFLQYLLSIPRGCLRAPAKRGPGGWLGWTSCLASLNTQKIMLPFNFLTTYLAMVLPTRYFVQCVDSLDATDTAWLPAVILQQFSHEQRIFIKRATTCCVLVQSSFVRALLFIVGKRWYHAMKIIAVMDISFYIFEAIFWIPFIFYLACFHVFISLCAAWILKIGSLNNFRWLRL